MKICLSLDLIPIQMQLCKLPLYEFSSIRFLFEKFDEDFFRLSTVLVHNPSTKIFLNPAFVK